MYPRLTGFIQGVQNGTFWQKYYRLYSLRKLIKSEFPVNMHMYTVKNISTLNASLHEILLEIAMSNYSSRILNFR